MNTKSEFRLALEANIKAAVKSARADGTVGMAVENLRMVTKSPSPYLKGAPLGANARYYYATIFNEVAREVAGRFLLGGAS
jgi:hypothetical protein